MINVAALAVLTVSSAAFAQSSVSISGNIDLSYVSAKTADGGKISTVQNGATSTSKIIFSGVEDLGGGLSAIFRANSTIAADRANTFVRQVNPNMGTSAAATSATNQGLAFGDRDLYIGLKGGFGELRVGRNQSISDDNNNAGGNHGSVWTYFMANSAAQAGVNNAFGGAAPVLGAAGRINDSFKYASPVFNGFQVQALYGLGERDNLRSEGVVTEAQVSYVQGPIAVSYSMGKIAAAPSDATTFGALAASSTQAALNAAAGVESKESRLMASYDLGMAKINVGTYNQKTAGAAADKASHVTLTMPMDAWTFGATYITVKDSAPAAGQVAKIDGFSVHAGYALSKRTRAYAFYRTMDKNGLAAQKAKPSATYIGLNHAF
ncbi:porin [Limnohabitans sp. 2KL-17]|uniref:porin n=1 Tax=Limnohabitans sp. 2KL-17 TaxID=1100704 RepID=UPI001304B273|nr:porin [Limnohabitans sp. 2KL-17]